MQAGANSNTAETLLNSEPSPYEEKRNHTIAMADISVSQIHVYFQKVYPCGWRPLYETSNYLMEVLTN